MTWAELRAYCLSLPGATETFPFEPAVSVFKAPHQKVFAITADEADPIDVSVKCDPEIGEALRAQHPSIVPGYHLNKRHWITITLGSDVPDERVRELVLDSYELVVPKAAAGRAMTGVGPASRSVPSVGDDAARGALVPTLRTASEARTSKRPAASVATVDST